MSAYPAGTGDFPVFYHTLHILVLSTQCLSLLFVPIASIAPLDTPVATLHLAAVKFLIESLMKVFRKLRGL